MGEETEGSVAHPDLSFDRRRRHSRGERLEERAGQLRELEALFKGLLPAPPAAMVVQGVWGSGKTALLNAACHCAGRHGLVVGRGRGRLGEPTGPLRVARETVEAALQAASQQPGGPDPDAGRSLLAPVGIDMSGDEVVDRLVPALETLPGRMILAIDDADRADSDSLRVLNSAVRRLPPGRATLVVTAGPRRPGGRLRSVDWLLAEPDTRLLTIGPLSPETVRRIARSYVDGPVPPGWADAMWRMTAGRPLLLFAALRSLEPTLVNKERLDDELTDAAAAGIAPFVLAREASLGASAAGVLAAAAVLGDGCDLNMVATVGGVEAASAERDVDAALNAELLATSTPVRFTSPLVRAALHLEIVPAKRAQLHRAAAEALQQLGMGEETVCEHLRLTDPAGDASIANRLWRCGRDAMDRGDPYRALLLLRRALAEPPGAEELADVLVDLALAEVALDRPEATEHFLRAARLGGGDTRHFAGAATLMLRRFPTSELLEPAADWALRRAVEEWPVGGEYAPIELHLALCRGSNSVRPDDLERLRARVERLGSKASAGARWADAYLVQEMVRTVGCLTAAEAGQRLLESFDPEEAVGSDVMAAEIQQASALVLLCCGYLSIGPRLEQSGRASAARPESRAAVTALMALCNLWEGQLDSAITLARGILHGGHPADEWVHRLATASLAAALLEKGRIGEAMALESSLEDPADVVEDWPFDVTSTVSRLFCYEVRSRLWAGVAAPALALEHSHAARDYAGTAGVSNPLLSSWRLEAAKAKLAAGSRDEAARLSEDALSLARSVGEVRGLVRALRLSGVVAPPDKAEVFLREAVDLLDGSPFRLEEAKSMVQLGRCLLSLGNRAEARSCLRRGANLAALCGADVLVESAATDMRAAGARPRRLALTGWEALTPAESRVAELAMSGATNAQIASALYVTEKTVEGHLARVYRKLGVRSRRQLRMPGTFPGDVATANPSRINGLAVEGLLGRPL